MVTVKDVKEDIIKYVKKNQKDKVCKINNRKELAEKLGISYSTLQRKLKSMEDKKEIVIETKKGVKGVTLLLLPTPKEKEENCVDDTKAYAQKVLEETFPRYKYERKTDRPRRTKVEMIEFNSIKDKERKALAEIAFRLKHQPYPTRDIFELAPNPEKLFKAYLLSKYYDVLCSVQMKVNVEKHQKALDRMENHLLEGNEQQLTLEYVEAQRKYRNDKIAYYTKLADKYRNRDTMGKVFVENKRFGNFLKLVDMEEELRDTTDLFTALGFMRHTFNTLSWLHDNYPNQYTRPYPQPNYLVSEKYVQNYQKYFREIKKDKSQSNVILGGHYNRFMLQSDIYVEDPLLQQISFMYKFGLDCDKVQDIDSKYRLALDLDSAIFELSTENVKIHSDLVKVEDKLTEKEVSKEDKELVMNYYKQLVTNEVSPSAQPDWVRVAMFPMQRKMVYDTHHMNSNGELNTGDMLSIGGVNLRAEHDRLELRRTNGMYTSNCYYVTDVLNRQIDIGAMYADIHTKYNEYYLSRMFGDMTGYAINMRDVYEVIKKYNLEGLIATDSYGRLVI